MAIPEDFLSTLADVERRLVALERSPQLTGASIKDGTLTVLDAAGVVRVKIGKDRTDYGVKVYDAAGANAVQLATLAFGNDFAKVDAEESTTSTSYVDLATVGPSVAVTVGPSGRAIAMGGAYVSSTVANQTVAVGLSVDGDVVAEMAAFGNSGGGSLSADVSSAKIVRGLIPGPHTFKLQYRQTLGGATGRFDARWLLVLPY